MQVTAYPDVTASGSAALLDIPQEQSGMKMAFDTALKRSKSLLSRSPQSNSGRKPRTLSDSMKTRPRIDSELGQDSSSQPPSHSVSAAPIGTTSPPPRPTPTRKYSDLTDVTVPQPLRVGTLMTKISAKSQKNYTFRLDAEQGQIVWVSKKMRIIPIEAIQDIRTFSEARYYREQFRIAGMYEDRWLSIFYVLEGRHKSLHLVSSTNEQLQMWDIALRKLHAIRKQLMNGVGDLRKRQVIWEKQYWKGADSDGDHKLALNDVFQLCKKLHISLSTEHLKQLFQSAGPDANGYLDFCAFQRFVKLLKARPDVEELFLRLCHNNGGVFSFDAFQDFMTRDQKSSLTRDEMYRIFVRYANESISRRSANIDGLISDAAASDLSSLNISDTSATLPITHVPTPTTTSETSLTQSPTITWTLEGFIAFLMSADNSAFVDKTHDMTQPLADYFISSSHNTYLLGSQLVGTSTVEGYIRALQLGCRSVELDIFDGENEPMVFHGLTLTTKVSAREVCQAIAKYAFVTSPYPVIISAEIHCQPAQQDMLVDIMKETFGDALLTAPIEGIPVGQTLPSPEDLKGKILFKAKKLFVSETEPLQTRQLSIGDESSASTSTSVSTSTSTEPESDVLDEIKQEWRSLQAARSDVVLGIKDRLQKVKKRFAYRRSPSPGPSSPIQSSPYAQPSGSRVPKAKMSAKLADLLVYTVGVKARGLNKKEHYETQHMFSISEKTANKMLKQEGMMHDLIKHNRTHLVRLYPKGLRVTSTNFEPHRFWAAGVQLVALNWQTFDMGNMINHTMFQRNGRLGYVLKPSSLRSHGKEKLDIRHKTFDVTVISAQQLPPLKDADSSERLDRSNTKFSVEVSIHVPDWPLTSPRSGSRSPSVDLYPSKLARSRSSTSATHVTVQRTNVVHNNGFNPVWNEALSLPFSIAGSDDMHDLIFVRFAVYTSEESSEPLAVHCASLGSLAMGYRHLPLGNNQLSQYLFSTLFVQMNIQDA